MRSRIMLIVAALVVALSASVGGATAAGLIGSNDIQDGSIKGKDLRPGVVNRLDQRAETKANDAEIKALKAEVAALKAQAAASAPFVADWPVKPGTTVTPTTVVLAADTAARPLGTSLETQDLGIPVLAGDTISFHYDLADGAVCGGGAPRMFVEINGTYTNSFDDGAGNPRPGRCGGDSRNVEFIVPAAGTIGHAGLVYDSGNGRATFSDVRVAGQLVNFS